MKKMFVLFLIVALLPFTTGCGIFGHSRDASGLAAMGTTVDFSVTSELAGSISGNLRASTVYTRAEIEAMTVTVDDVLMSWAGFVTESPIKIKFAAKVSTVKLQQIVEKNEPVAMIIKNNKGEAVKKFNIVLPQEIIAAGDKAAPAIEINPAGKMTIKVTPKSSAKPVVALETTKGDMIKLTPDIHYKKMLGEGLGHKYEPFKNKMELSAERSPDFLINFKNGSTFMDLTNMSCTFQLKVTKDGSNTIAEYRKEMGEDGSYEGANQNLFLKVVTDYDTETDEDLTIGGLMVEVLGDLRSGTYRVSIPLIAFTDAAGKTYGLEGLTYSFKIQ